ncbi:MAG TPA: methylamine utilization protein [Gammaproteobacteria bacterium]
MKTVFLSALLLLAAPALTAETPATGILVAGQLRAGRVDTDTPPDLREAVVFFRSASVAAALPGADAEMRMSGKAFAPGVLAITAGTLVRFPNTDPILHNAFSTSPQGEFDLGFYGAGESRERRFDTPGLVRVYCNVHHGMVGYVMVLDTPFFTQPDADGRFLLRLPRGVKGTLYVWHPQAAALREEIDTAADRSLELPVDFTGRRLPRHLNKFGKHYGQRTQRQY